MMKQEKSIICLWYDGGSEAAARGVEAGCAGDDDSCGAHGGVRPGPPAAPTVYPGVRPMLA